MVIAWLIAIVAVILLLVYRSPVLWIASLAAAIAAIVTAQASAHGLADGGLTVSTLSADILIVLVFGAASDYALLVVHTVLVPASLLAIGERAWWPSRRRGRHRGRGGRKAASWVTGQISLRCHVR